ncbi:MAG: matrixin family metalloprotease [Parcubacteria group bacterium]|jgi:predicted Zn-dependent protease
MKKFFQYLAIVILFSTWGTMLKNKTSFREAVLDAKEAISEMTGIGLPCSKPFKYAIGSVDPKFGLSTNEFLIQAQEAENIWESQSGKNLFEYDPNSQFKINLIFDSRQVQSNEADKLNENLDQLESSHKKITDQYENLSGTYEQKTAKYNADVADYQKKLDAYNKAVADWNKNGGSKDEYAELKEDKEDLENLYEKLEKERLEVNSLAGKTNALVSKEQKVVNEYNTNVSTYTNKYGGGQEFEKGLYDGEEINIYQFKQTTDLRLTLVHELGHALGIGHVEDSKSIMYYLMGEQDMENPVLSAEDLGALKTVCKFK